jgi:hypothetical protein
MPKGFSEENNNWTEEELNILRKNKYLYAKDIAKLLSGRTPKAIRDMFSKLGIARRKIINEEWTNMELQTLKQNADHSIVEIMLLLPTRSEWGIKHKYNQLGIDRSYFAANDLKEFIVPGKSEDFAYFLGALCSDGWNSGNSIGLSAKDKDFVEAFEKIGCNLFGVKPISRVIDRSHLKNHSNMYEVQFVSRGLCRFLGDVSEKNWCFNNRIRFVKRNKKYASAFLSGYIDGDGHVDKYNISIASQKKRAKKFLSGLILNFGDEFVIGQDTIRLNKPLVDKIRSKLSLKIKRKLEALR